MIKLSPPIDDFSWKDNISQFFGQNRELYQKNFGIPGHNAIDIVVPNDPKRGFGTPIKAAHDGIVEKIIYDVPHKTKGNGIYLVSLDGAYTTIYWHLASFEAQIGQKVKRGQTIGTMGNSGFVRPKPSKDCPHCGTHVHFGVKLNTPIPYKNYHGGYVDPVPFLFEPKDRLPVSFAYDLHYGSRGDKVSHLQTLLRLEGFAHDYDPIGIYGLKTVRDVSRFQRKHGIWPPAGYFGRLTRQKMHELYSSHFTV